jgi:hypothetical protein
MNSLRIPRWPFRPRTYFTTPWDAYITKGKAAQVASNARTTDASLLGLLAAGAQWVDIDAF